VAASSGIDARPLLGRATWDLPRNWRRFRGALVCGFCAALRLPISRRGEKEEKRKKPRNFCPKTGAHPLTISISKQQQLQLQFPRTYSDAPDAPTNEHSSGPPLRTGGLTKLGAPDTPDAGEPQPRAGHSQASDAHRHQQQVVKTTVNAGGQTRSRYRQYKAPRSSSSVSSGGHHFGGCTLGMGELLAVLVAQLVLLRTVGRSLGAHTSLEVEAV